MSLAGACEELVRTVVVHKLLAWPGNETSTVISHSRLALTVGCAPFLGSRLNQVFGSHVQRVCALSGEQLAVSWLRGGGRGGERSGQLQLPEMGGGGELGELGNGLEGARKKGVRENGAREKGTRKKRAREKGARENGAREKGARENGAREKGARENGVREKGVKEKGAREKGAREKGVR